MTVLTPFPPNRWARHAACLSAPVELFFPGEGYKGKYEEAAPFCARCLVQPECLEWALTHENFGYWGGTSERQRERIRKDREHLKVLAMGPFAV